MIRSKAKYSTKKMQSYPSALPNNVCNIACPVLSATAQHLYAYPPVPNLRLYPPKAL